MPKGSQVAEATNRPEAGATAASSDELPEPPIVTYAHVVAGHKRDKATEAERLSELRRQQRGGPAPLEPSHVLSNPQEFRTCRQEIVQAFARERAKRGAAVKAAASAVELPTVLPDSSSGKQAD